ncbi:MAG: RluA family pseudouridine synthase [Saprospiraceae bacterium]|nr:RluA family pseudouridine synthase [Saprospiraceae bacterium]MCB9322439.1 RluA family pseudouridine synthase [Lewinellaceae bacterium]
MDEKNFDELQEAFYETYDITVDPKQSPLRIDKFLLDRLAKVSRSKIQLAIKAGSITVDDEEIKPNFKIKPGHKITVVLPRTFDGETEVIPEDIPLDIRYEDDDLLIVHKPPGMVVHPGIGNRTGTLVNALAWHFKDLPVMEGNSNDRIGLVHRIDKDTSGLLVVAKTDFAMTKMAKQFFDHTIDRTYTALVWGNMEEEEGTIIGNIGRHPVNRKIRTVYPEGEEGKHAVTHYKVLTNYYYVSLVECRLETGRTHQIRVHMKYLGHPLFNDMTYGGDRIVKGTVFSKYKSFVENTFKVLPRQALHAKSLGFVHPTKGEYMFFESDLPDDFKNALSRWEKYLDGRKAALKSDEI